MSEAVLYAFAVDADVPSAEGMAPFDVMARQLPRLAVQLLNGAGDRGLRFFPFIGVAAEQRQFLAVNELLPVEVLLQLHGQKPGPRYVVDGCLHAMAMRLRIFDSESGRSCFDRELPFDPCEPLPVVSRVMFEVGGALGWSGAPPAVPELRSAALAHYLVAKDQLLCLEAGLDLTVDTALDAAERVLVLAPDVADVRALFLEICGRRVSLGVTADVEGVLSRARDVVAAAADDAVTAEFAATVAAIAEAAQLPVLAADLRGQVARLLPADGDAACRAAAALHDIGRWHEARAVLRAVHDRGGATALLLSQLAMIEEHLGNSAAVAPLLEDLAQRSDLTPAMVRIATGYLLDRERTDEALAILSRALAAAPDDPSMWFEKGRALLLAGRESDAVVALNHCLEHEPDDVQRRDAERSLGLAGVTGAFATLMVFDQRLARGDPRGALDAARRLAARAPDLAEAWLLVGVARLRLNHRRRAERALRRALALQPDHGEANHRLGISLVARGRADEALTYLLEAVRLLPADAAPRIHLAQAYRLIGALEEGLKTLDEAVERGGDAATIDAVRAAFPARDGDGSAV